MNRELALKVVSALVGVLFLGLVYPWRYLCDKSLRCPRCSAFTPLRHAPRFHASSNPPANRSLIAFTAWSSFAHAAVMGTQALRNMISREELIRLAVFGVFGAALIALAPTNQTAEPASRP